MLKLETDFAQTFHFISLAYEFIWRRHRAKHKRAFVSNLGKFELLAQLSKTAKLLGSKSANKPYTLCKSLSFFDERSAAQHEECLVCRA